MKPIAISIAARPLLAALALAFATTACQRDEAPIEPALDESADTTPVDTMPAPLPPPMQEIDPCANLMGAELDECLRRQAEPPTTPPPSEQLPPPTEQPPTEPEESPAPPPPG